MTTLIKCQCDKIFSTKMLSAKTAALLRSTSLTLQSVRFRGKINIQRPQKLHYERARLVALTTPVYQNTTEPAKKCTVQQQKNIKTEIANQYEKIIAKEVLNWFNHSKCVIIAHMNSIPQDEWFKIRVALHKHNVHMKTYGKSIVKQALTDSKYEGLLPLFESKTCILFGKENKVLQSLKVLKKYPQIIVLTGILDNHILSKNELVEFGSMANASLLHAKLVSTIQSGATSLVGSLENHQAQLVNILNVHQHQLSNK